MGRWWVCFEEGKSGEDEADCIKADGGKADLDKARKA
jgi:hypothetical protein